MLNCWSLLVHAIYASTLWHSLFYTSILWPNLSNASNSWSNLSYASILRPNLSNVSNLWTNISYASIFWPNLYLAPNLWPKWQNKVNEHMLKYI